MVKVKKKIYKPKNDNEFLEQLSHIIFVLGFNYSIVEKKWPGIRKAFDNFKVDKVSKYTDNDFNRLMKAKDMIKNRRKIKAIIENAKQCKELEKEHGSVLKWIAKLKKERQKDLILAPRLAEFFETFIGIGKTSSVWMEALHEAKGTFLEYEMERKS